MSRTAVAVVVVGAGIAPAADLVVGQMVRCSSAAEVGRHPTDSLGAVGLVAVQEEKSIAGSTSSLGSSTADLADVVLDAETDCSGEACFLIVPPMDYYLYRSEARCRCCRLGSLTWFWPQSLIYYC